MLHVKRRSAWFPVKSVLNQISGKADFKVVHRPTGSPAFLPGSDEMAACKFLQFNAIDKDSLDGILPRRMWRSIMNYAHSCVRWTAEVDANGAAIEAKTERSDSEHDYRSDREEASELIKS